MFSSPRSKAKLAKRSFQRPAPPDRSCIDRINEVTATARSVWFGLLSFLAFVSLSLVGVEDKDFFLTDRQTTLPLVGVDVPTFLFFAVTPFLGFILYSYFHLHLLKLWEALADAPGHFESKHLSDHVRPWLVTDVALSYRDDEALRPRPLARWAHWINLIIAFAGTPIVLAGFWYRSFSPHIDWLTLWVCGLPLSATIYVGWTSWTRMRAMARRDTGVGRQRRIVRLSSMVALVILGIGWLRVEGTFANYLKTIGVEQNWLEASVLGQTFAPDLLYPANLAGATFAPLPDGWEDRESFRVSYRATWCAGRGLAPSVCGPAPDLDRPVVGETLTAARAAWCNDLIARSQSEGFDCARAFERLDAEYERDWLARREADLRGLPRFDLAQADLRNARLTGAQLQGAVLGRAQLQGAVLNEAQLQGALLRGAQLQGAYLVGAQLDEATDLSAATLRGAALRSVDDTTLAKLEPFWEDIFADGTVQVPEGKRPGHWANEELESFLPDEFSEAWRAWQRSIGQDPDKPE